jgi:4-diphosphocytidyl-2-C-methyl-D-erythritol kinase
MWVHASASTVEVLAPAKLNLFLEVIEKRADGYHEIETLMLPVSLWDSLYFSPSVSERPSAAQTPAVVFSGEWANGAWRGDEAEIGFDDSTIQHQIPQGGDNLVVKAVELLRRRAGTDAGATIRLVKRIPMAAGLGGGSSNAAAALVAANLAWRLGYSARELAPLAAQLGSDVPFFLARTAAICRGRGERVEPLEPRALCHFVIVQPPQGLATAEVYRHCRPVSSPRTSGMLVEAVRRGDLRSAGRLLHNTLEPAALRLSPWIAQLKEDFQRLRVVGHQMSGSGASYFGWCANFGYARRAASQLRGLGWKNVYVVRGRL